MAFRFKIFSILSTEELIIPFIINSILGMSFHRRLVLRSIDQIYIDPMVLA